MTDASLLRSTVTASVRVACVASMLACGETSSDTPSTQPAAAVPEQSELVGYDVRRLRPRNEETLAAMFDRMQGDAVAGGKQVAVLFSAGWCEPCRLLELELGNLHPQADIGHVRIFELKEEDWEAVTRMNEFNDLRRRWYAPLNSYPVFVVLDAHGQKIEEMKEAIARLEQGGVEPTVSNWFRDVRL